MKASSLGALPFMKSAEDAIALCQKEQDNFYLTAFMIEAWLGQVVIDSMAQYAENKSATDRAMQTGQAWRFFQETFRYEKNADLPHVLSALCRFSEYDDPQARLLNRAVRPLSMEHECFGDFIGPKTEVKGKRRGEAAMLLRQTIERLCQWVDAVNHFDTHELRHLSPVSFDPDPEKRELAALGINQQCYAGLSDFSKNWWQWHHSEAAERFKESPKWRMVGTAMSSKPSDNWTYQAQDEVLIWFWPLVTRYNWTYRDLINVARGVLPLPLAYPFQREQDVASYCANVLGLRKRAKGKTAKDGRPRGHEIALRLCERTEPRVS
jgi:hypothetical protein